MKRSILFICFLSLSAFFSSCKQEVLTPAILVSPGGIHITANAGELIEFTIEALAGDKDLNNVRINQKPSGSITTSVLDSSITGRKASFFFIYSIPTGTDEIILSFVVTDEDGNTGETARKIFVSGNEYLQESPGHELYSSYSQTNPNLFNVGALTPLFQSNNPDSSNVDLVEFDDSDDGNLSNAITSWSGVKFVRNNSFNYPEASQSSAAGSFESSTALQVINDIQVDDILITKYDTINDLFAVIKITGITDNDGSDEDRYEFNVMK